MNNAPRDRDDLSADLKATLAARRDVGPEMDDELVDLFLARVDGYIKSEVAGQVALRTGSVSARQPMGDRPVHISRVLLWWQGFLFLAALLLAGSIVFGAHVHAFPLVATLILLTVFLSHRWRHAGRGSRSL